jgi:DNA-binding NtrC family response regulator
MSTETQSQERGEERLRGKVLVAEERPESTASAFAILRAAGAQVRAVTSAQAVMESLGQVRAELPDLIVTEARWRDGNGFSILSEARRLAPSTPVVLYAGHPTVGEAVRAMEEGAESYVGIPLVPDLVRAAGKALRRPLVGGLPRRAPRSIPPKGLVGRSPAMTALAEQVNLVGPTRTTVLLLGETGTGKELLAQALHDISPRRRAPFVAVNCAALTESELFGHERGAFSGAHTRREGRFKMADGGTLFLDEIGEISPAIQIKLLRVLQEREFQRVGGNETLSVDVRIIAATNRDLREMVSTRAFRADLYYRLNVVALEVPPLRARSEDIPALVGHILPRLACELGIQEPSVTPAGMQALLAHNWPGNVRELENVLERAVILSGGAPLSELLLCRQLVTDRPLAPANAAPPVPGSTFAEIERHAIITTYEACGRSPQKAASILGLSPRTIHYRLREYDGKQGRRLRPLERTACADTLHLVR